MPDKEPQLPPKKVAAFEADLKELSEISLKQAESASDTKQNDSPTPSNEFIFQISLFSFDLAEEFTLKRKAYLTRETARKFFEYETTILNSILDSYSNATTSFIEGAKQGTVNGPLDMDFDIMLVPSLKSG